MSVYYYRVSRGSGLVSSRIKCSLSETVGTNVLDNMSFNEREADRESVALFQDN